VDIPFRN